MDATPTLPPTCNKKNTSNANTSNSTRVRRRPPDRSASHRRSRRSCLRPSNPNRRNHQMRRIQDRQTTLEIRRRIGPPVDVAADGGDGGDATARLLLPDTMDDTDDRHNPLAAIWRRAQPCDHTFGGLCWRCAAATPFTWLWAGAVAVVVYTGPDADPQRLVSAGGTWLIVSAACGPATLLAAAALMKLWTPPKAPWIDHGADGALILLQRMTVRSAVTAAAASAYLWAPQPLARASASAAAAAYTTLLASGISLGMLAGALTPLAALTAWDTASTRFRGRPFAAD